MASEDEEDRIQQVGGDAHADKSGVRDNVPSRGRRIAGNVHLGIHKSFGKAAEDADEQVEDAGDPCKTYGFLVFHYSGLFVWNHFFLGSHRYSPLG